jgi:hypothetical protein
MSLSRPSPWYHSHVDPIGPDGTFKERKKSDVTYVLDLVLLEVLDWMLRLSVQVDGDMIPSEAEFITLSCTGQKTVYK